MLKIEIPNVSDLANSFLKKEKPIKGLINANLKQYAIEIFFCCFDLNISLLVVYSSLCNEDKFLKKFLTYSYFRDWLSANKNKRKEIEESLKKFCKDYPSLLRDLQNSMIERKIDLSAVANGTVALPSQVQAISATVNSTNHQGELGQVAKLEVSNNKVNIANNNEFNQPLISSQVSANNVASTKSVNQSQATAVASTPTFALKKVVKKEEVDPEAFKQKQRDLIGPRPVLPITPIHQNDPRYPFSRDVKNDVIGYDQNGVLFDLLSSENQNDVLPIPTFLDIQCQASDKLISYKVKKNDNEDLPYAFKENSYPFTWDLFHLLLRSEGSIKNGSVQFYVIDVN